MSILRNFVLIMEEFAWVSSVPVLSPSPIGILKATTLYFLVLSSPIGAESCDIAVAQNKNCIDAEMMEHSSS